MFHLAKDPGATDGGASNHHSIHTITLETLAAIGGCSKCTLIRMFRRAFDNTPVGYLIAFRLERSREMVEKSTLPISEIALRNGFSDSNYFTKLFHRRYGKSPRDYRKQLSFFS